MSAETNSVNEEIPPVSSDEEDEENLGHPEETTEEVLKNLANGFKYHKNGPARGYVSIDSSQ